MMEGTKKIYYVTVGSDSAEIAGIYSSMQKAREAVEEFAEGAPIEWRGSIYEDEDSGVIKFAPLDLVFFDISYFWLDGSLGVY